MHFTGVLPTVSFFADWRHLSCNYGIGGGHAQRMQAAADALRAAFASLDDDDRRVYVLVRA